MLKNVSIIFGIFLVILVVLYAFAKIVQPSPPIISEDTYFQTLRYFTNSELYEMREEDTRLLHQHLFSLTKTSNAQNYFSDFLEATGRTTGWIEKTNGGWTLLWTENRYGHFANHHISEDAQHIIIYELMIPHDSYLTGDTFTWTVSSEGKIQTSDNNTIRLEKELSHQPAGTVPAVN